MLNKVIGGGRTGSKEGVVNAMMSTAGVRIPEKLPPRSQLFDHSSGKECYIILVDVPPFGIFCQIFNRPMLYEHEYVAL